MEDRDGVGGVWRVENFPLFDIGKCYRAISDSGVPAFRKKSMMDDIVRISNKETFIVLGCEEYDVLYGEKSVSHNAWVVFCNQEKFYFFLYKDVDYRKRFEEIC